MTFSLLYEFFSLCGRKRLCRCKQAMWLGVEPLSKFKIEQRSPIFCSEYSCSMMNPYCALGILYSKRQIITLELWKRILYVMYSTRSMYLLSREWRAVFCVILLIFLIVLMRPQRSHQTENFLYLNLAKFIPGLYKFEYLFATTWKCFFCWQVNQNHFKDTTQTPCKVAFPSLWYC